MQAQVQLLITLSPEGQIGVQGPLEQPLICYGLLECARQAIEAHCKKAQERIVQPAVLEPGGLALGRNRG